MTDDREVPAVELIDVTVAFGDRVVLDHVDLTIRPHAITLIVGASGSGKTVLLKTMLGLIRPTRGTVRLLGRDLAEISEVELVELRRRVAMLFQNYALFDGLSVQDNVEFPLYETLHASPQVAHRVAGEILSLLGLAGNEAVFPGELSGGMKKRVGLARALVGHPELVLFDEPTTGLDPLMVEHVDRMIATARRETSITAVIVSHDLASVKRLADRVAFLDGGTICFEGTRDEFFASEVPAIRKLLGIGALPSATPSTPPPESPVIELIDVHKSFGDKHVLRGVNLQILPHQITVLLGASGSGKSVIAKHVLGLLKPDRGQIVVFGTDIVPLSDRELLEIRARFGLVFQSGALLDWLSVEDNVAFPLLEHEDHVAIRARVAEILRRLELAGVASRFPAELSTGERKRVALARAMVGHPDVVIYDEPTTGQDLVRSLEVDELIQWAQRQFGITSLVISHDLTSAFRIAHRIAMLRDGRIIACGTPAELQSSTDPYVQRFLHAAA